MNDIETLEKMLEREKECLHYDISQNEVQAIENLIKENKELKEKLEEKDMQHELELIGIEEYTKDAMGEIIEHYYTANEDCIPKSKVKEKIEKLDKEEQDLQNSISDKEREEYSDAMISWQLCDIEGKRETLQELLEEGE